MSYGACSHRSTHLSLLSSLCSELLCAGILCIINEDCSTQRITLSQESFLTLAVMPELKVFVFRLGIASAKRNT